MGSDTTNSTGWASISYLIPGSASVGSHILNATYIGSTSSYLNPSNTSTSINVHDIPHIKDISATPQTVGYGFNVSIRANVTDLDSVDTVFVNITYPDESSTWQEMSNYSTDIYEYNLSDTWQWGNYTYYIWANDTAGKINQTTSYTFYVRANAWVRVATLNNSYSSDEDVNLTGPEEVWWNTSWQYRQGVNITEPGVNDKVNWPVDVDIATGSHADNCTREFRVVDDDGDSVPYTVHNESYSGGKCVSANVVFLVNISQTETRSYWIYYGNPSATEETFSIWADSCSETLNSSNCSTIHYSRHVLSAGLDSWTTGTTVTDGDDVKAQANLQWNFSYFNQDFSSAWLCTNGFLDFNGSAGTSFTNTENAFKSHVMIAPLWDDLNCYTQGASDEHVYQDDYSNRTVFTWDCSISGDNDNDLQVQIVLYEAGDIMVRYGPITDDSVFSPTAGASNGDNTNYLHNPWGSNEKTAFYQYSRSRNLSKGGEESIWGSQITNLGDTNISGYLLMLVQRNDSGIWTNLSTVVSDASSRIINQSQDLDLSEIWDTYGGWNTNDYTDGEYRVYVAFRNPDNDTLQNDDGSLMLASYVFNITGEPPLIRDVAATPQTVGYGNNVSLKANVTDNGAVSTVFVNITHPDGSSTWQEMVNYSADFYEYNFSDTWQWGNYTYYIWSNDSGGNSNRSGNYTFYVRSNVTIGIQTQLNEYGSNEDINLTNSWSNNTGAVDTNGYLLMLIQRNDSTQWINISTVVANEFHNISSGNALNLSLIWGNNGGWNTDQYAKDTYRVYAELRDPSNNTLLNDTGGYICGWYEFKITPAVIANITRIRIYNVSGSLNPHSDTSDLVDSGLNKTFSLYQDEVYRIEVMVNNTCESKSTWVISDTVIANHTNLNPAWDINYTQDVWYSNETENFTGGNWSNGDVTWNTSLGGSVPINSSVTFHYILNLSNNPTEQRQVIFHIEDSSFTDDDYSAFRIMDKTPPALYNDIYDINATSVSRGESLYLYARWNEGIDSAYAEYNTTSSALQNHTITLPDPNPQNWTNHTIQTNSSWIRGQHVVRILVNDSYGNWDTTLHYLNFTVWALADIDNATLDPDWIYQGSSTTMKCLVRESDTDNPVQGYTVYFYNSTSLLGTNTTNASGWATWTFTDYSLGKENITCNITDWASSFYNKSLSNEGMDELFTAETEAPGYSNVGPSDGTVVHKNDSTPLEANWTDNLELDYAWLATNETGSWENKSGIYNSPQALSGTQDWSNFTWTNLSFTQGQLGWRIYANDTSGNENLTPIMTLGVWGWAEVDASLLNPSVIESGGKTNMSCHVRDANNLVSIANYTVYFYNSTDLMGTNVTNASGWAVFNFTDSSPGTETITCGIENDASLYYNITSDYYLEEDLVTGTPPRLWNDIYNITPNTVFKGTNLSLYARWDENISAAFALYNSTSPTVNEYAMDVPKDNPGNWTNYTIETNGSWLVGGHVAKIRANDTEDNWNNTLPYLNFTVWGWSKAEWNSPTGSVDRGMITLRCNVTDNLSKEGVYNYPVYFYNHSGIPVGSSNTNASGVASLNLDTSGYPVGSQSFSCVTYDAPTLYYNRSGDYQASQSITLMGTLNVSTDNPVNGTIVYMGENISLNSSTRDENNLDVTPDTANWYNSTDKNIGSGEDISWVIGASYELGPELIKVNVSKTSYKPDEDNVTLLVYGWSNVSWISPNETSAYVQGTMVDLTCRVRDVNNSGDLEGYTVYFYYNTTADAYLGINSSNSSGHAVFTWNTSSAGVGTYYPKCNITEDPSVYYNASEVNEANTTVNITSLGYLEVNLTMPPTGVLNHVGQNKTFVMNASVTCRGADCGNVDGTARYNTTSSQHDTEMPVGSGSPFHIVGAQNTQDCLNNPLSQNESCTLNWTVNATGAVYSTWNVGVKFTSQSAGTASTDSAEISIDMVLVMTVSNYTLDFGVGIDSVDPSENCSSAKNDPITITMDENSNNADAIWIKGTDLTAGANAIGVGNITWSKGTSCATAKGDGNFLSYDYKKVHETLVAGDSIDTYYWIDIPPTPFAVYTGSMYIMANASY
ncbi:MAG: hypothetical protein U9Q22_07830 [Candidatus Altiarchaeota archaeon]|nr:hypothetical protein [Candidatus Altiarchaeota archaeon]